VIGGSVSKPKELNLSQLNDTMIFTSTAAFLPKCHVVWKHNHSQGRWSIWDTNFTLSSIEKLNCQWC